MNVSQLKAPDTLFIYQMGKVGSTALEQALPNAVHMHSLFQNPPCPARQALSGGGFSGLRRRLSDAAKVRVIRSRPKTKIISLVREPLDRNIAMFFQDLHFWLSAYIEKYPHRMRDEGQELLVDAFNELFPHDYPCTWFDREVKQLTGIDVFEHPFDRSEGYSIITNGPYELLVLRLDQLSALLSEISDFVGSEVLLPQANRGDAKWYADAYRQFKADYQPSLSMQTLLNDSQYSQHFFGDH